MPKGLFAPSNKVPEVNGGVEAAEALFLATLNVTSCAIMLGGGAMWALDISEVEDLRRKVRKKMDVEGGEGKTPQEAEDDIEEWIAFAMAKLQGKSDQDIAEMVKQAAQKGNLTKEEIKGPFKGT